MSVNSPTEKVQLPAAGHVHLWVALERNPLAQDDQQQFASWLDSEEQERWHRFKFAGDRQRFLQARALVRGVLASYLQQKPASLQFTRNQYGKPQLQQQLASLRFNLSHTRGLLVLAVTADAEVGVDVEAISREVEMLALAERFFAPAETALIKAGAEAAQRECFFRLWTLKEAYVKARGLGLQLGLDSFAFHFDAKGQPQLTMTDASGDPADWSFLQLSYAEDFRIAVAVQSAAVQPLQLHVREWPWAAPVFK